MFRTLLLSFHFVCIFGSGLEKPSSLPCSLENAKCNTDMMQWIFNLAIEGDPKKGIENLDPLYHDTVEGNLGIVNYTLKAVNVDGFKNCKVVNVSFDQDFTSQQLNLQCPHLHISGGYDIFGKLISLPIRGNGDFYADIRNYLITIDTNPAFYKQGENLYIKLKTVNTQAEYLGGFSMVLMNLFDGNKELGDQANRFIEENSKAVGIFTQEPYLKKNVKSILKNFNKVLKEIPITDLVQVNEKSLRIEKP